MVATRGSRAAGARLVATVLCAALPGCFGARSAEDAEPPPPDEIELQEGLERVTGSFIARAGQAAEPLLAPDAPREVRNAASQQVLRYHSSILDIATGRFPEVNLLDMLAFLELCEAALEEHWIPEVFGEAGRPLVEAFASSSQDLALLARRVLSPAQLEEAHQLVLDWRRDHPGQWRVEAVRLFGFAATAGRLSDERQRRASGLLSSVKAATRSADQALLLGERAMFLVQRLPFLMRSHARVTLQQLLDEALLTASEVERSLGPASALHPLLQELSTLAERSGQAALDTRELVDAVQPLLEPQRPDEALRIERLVTSSARVVDDSRLLVQELERVEGALASANRLASRSSALLEQARDLMPDGAAGRQLDALARRWFVYAALLGLVLVTLFWGGWVVASRFTRGERVASAREPAAREPAQPGARR